MHALAFLLGSRALDLAYSSNAGRPPREEGLGPIASTPETAAAWRRWRNGGAATDVERAHRSRPRPFDGEGPSRLTHRASG